MFTETSNSVLSRYFLFLDEKKVTKEKSRISIRSPHLPRCFAPSVRQGVPYLKFECQPVGLTGIYSFRFVSYVSELGSCKKSLLFSVFSTSFAYLYNVKNAVFRVIRLFFKIFNPGKTE